MLWYSHFIIARRGGAGNKASWCGWWRELARQLPSSRGAAAKLLCSCVRVLETLKMDIEQLISEVSRTPAIWDPSHTKHNDRLFIANQWRRIGDKLGVTGKSCRLFKLCSFVTNGIFRCISCCLSYCICFSACCVVFWYISIYPYSILSIR